MSRREIERIQSSEVPAEIMPQSSREAEPIELKPKPSREPSGSPQQRGQIITFYSYKGGTGRSMALANVAWLLALSGKRVLIVDWDLEAPGLHRYFHPFLEDKELVSTEGLLDFVENLAIHSATCSESRATEEADVMDYVLPLEWPKNPYKLDWKHFGPRARIDLVPAGRQGPAYARKFSRFNWEEFYVRLGGRRLLGAVAEQLRGIYDYVLIDSRTGVSDTSGICTVEAPDALVICFTLNQQSIVGASAIAEFVKTTRASTLRPIRIFPVPSRIEINEHEKLRIGLELAQKTFSPFLDHLSGISPSQYWGRVQLVYFPFYAFEEIPAVFGDSPNQLVSLTTAIKQLTRAVTGLDVTANWPLAETEEDSTRARRHIRNWYLRSSSASQPDAVRVAQEIYDRLPADQADHVMAALTRLVQVGDANSLGPQAALLAEFGELRSVLAPFIQAALVEVRSAGQEEALAFPDSVLIDRWTTLRDWIAGNRPFLVLRQTADVAMHAWTLHDSDDNLLLRGKLLEEANFWVSAKPADFTKAERDFIERSNSFAQHTAEAALEDQLQRKQLASKLSELEARTNRPSSFASGLKAILRWPLRLRWYQISAGCIALVAIGAGLDYAKVQVAKRAAEQKFKDQKLSGAAYAQGAQDFDDSKFKEAIAAFNQAISYNPKSQSALVKRGASYYMMHQVTPAIADLDAALALNPKDAEALYWRAYCDYDLGFYEQAIAGFQKAISVAPNYAEAYRGLADTYFQLKRPDQCLIAANQAVALAQTNKAALLRRGACSGAEGEYAADEADMQKLLTIDSDYAPAYGELGWIYNARKEYAKAVQALDTSVRLDPSAYIPYWNRAWSHFYLEQYQDALKDIQKALSMNPTDIDRKSMNDLVNQINTAMAAKPTEPAAGAKTDEAQKIKMRGLRKKN